MRKALMALLIALACTLAFASVTQKIYPVDSPIYETISDIYLMSGHAMPSSSGPWSAAELSAMLDAIDASEIPSYLIEEYNRVKSELSKSLKAQDAPMSVKFTLNTNIELYAHTNTDGQTRTDINGVTEKVFTGRSGWSYDLVHQKPFLELDLEFDVKNHFYFFTAAEARSGLRRGAGYDKGVGNANLGTNIPGLYNLPLDVTYSLSMDPNWPYRAFASFGSSHWNVQIGRDRISWGLGRTGNLAISDTLPYHDMLRLTAFSSSFKYTFLISSFPHKINFYKPFYQGSDKKGLIEKAPIQGINLYLAHRVEGRVLKDKLSFSITEAIMYASEDAVIDPRIFNPTSVFHNYYTPSNTNSTIIGEIDFTPIKGLNIYAQLLVDDLAIPGENGSSSTEIGYPNAMGYLLGASYAMPAWGGLLKFNLEGALVDPYTYLRYCVDPDNASYELYGIDYIVSTRTYVTGSEDGDSLVYDEYYLGYRYGGDSAVVNLNMEWKDLKSLTISANAFFMAHGTHDKWTRWDIIGGNGDDWSKTSVTPTSSHETGSYRYDDEELAKRNAVCYTLDLGLFCQYQISDKMKVYGQADFIQIWNSLNRSGVNENDTQFVVGFKYSL